MPQKTPKQTGKEKEKEKKEKEKEKEQERNLIAVHGTKSNVNARSGHEESKSQNQYLQQIYSTLVQIHGNAAASSITQNDASKLLSDINTELTWISAEIKYFHDEQQTISELKQLLKDRKAHTPPATKPKTKPHPTTQNSAIKGPTYQKENDVSIIKTEILLLMDDFKKLEADVKCFHEEQHMIFELKQMFKDRKAHTPPGTKPKTKPQPTTQNSAIKGPTNQKENDVSIIKTEILLLMDDFKKLDADVKSFLSLTRKTISETQKKETKQKKGPQLQDQVTVSQALDEINSFVREMAKQTEQAASKKQVLFATNEKQPKKEHELMMTCLLNITGQKEKSKNGTDIKQLTDESRKVVENLNKTIREYEDQKKDLIDIVRTQTPDTFNKINSEKKKEKTWDNFSNLMCEVIKDAVSQKDRSTVEKEHWTMKTFLLGYSKKDQQKSYTDVKIDELVKASEDVTQSVQQTIRFHENFRKDVITKTELAVQYIHDKNRSENLTLENNSNDSDLNIFCTHLLKLLKCVENENADFDRKLANETKQLREENEGLQTRLSKLAGSRLTENNPSITNLGDPNRPMKIAEMYSELYDNEWTDMMDKFEKGKKKQNATKVLQALYSTLVGCYQICVTKSTALEEQAKALIQSAAKVLMIEGLEGEVINQAKPLRKLHSETAADQLFKEVKSSKDQSTFKLMKVDKDMMKEILPTEFFRKCIKLCWMMIMQDPPMILQEGPKPGSTYDKNVFREYTSSGTKVEFTIWPALMLNEGGPLLVKGVVSVK